MKTPPQNLQRREIAEVSEDLNVFEFLQNSEESDDLIQKYRIWKYSLWLWAQMSTDNDTFGTRSRHN